jgi:uncharacterized protein YceK
MMKTAIPLALLLSGCATLTDVKETAASKEATYACQLADVATTKVALVTGAGSEANPIMRGLLGHGFATFVAVKLGFAWLLTQDQVPPEGRIVANTIACGAAINNTAIIVR